MLSTITFSQPLYARPLTVMQPNRDESGFYSCLDKISQYIFCLSSECRCRQFDIAQNTFLDMQQQWQRLDILALAFQDDVFYKTCWSSESLLNLEGYLNELYLSGEDEICHAKITKEIKRIYKKVDQMQALKISYPDV